VTRLERLVATCCGKRCVSAWAQEETKICEYLFPGSHRPNGWLLWTPNSCFPLPTKKPIEITDGFLTDNKVCSVLFSCIDVFVCCSALLYLKPTKLVLWVVKCGDISHIPSRTLTGQSPASVPVAPVHHLTSFGVLLKLPRFGFYYPKWKQMFCDLTWYLVLGWGPGGPCMRE